MSYNIKLKSKVVILIQIQLGNSKNMRGFNDEV